jgi:hypothetical protein
MRATDDEDVYQQTNEAGIARLADLLTTPLAW